MTEHDQLVQLCQKMGSPLEQAETMARQLSKRADQLISQRGMSRIDAMGYLLKVLIKGRSGEGPDQIATPETNSDEPSKTGESPGL